jgi:flagellar motor protein MotB
MKTTFNLLGCCLFCFILTNACSNSVSSNTQKATASYFSLQQFFNDEAQRLQKNNTKLEKVITLNENEETKTISNIDWQKELALFKEADLNKPSWYDQYRIDSTQQNQELHISYTALNDKLRTKSVQLIFSNNNNYPHLIKIARNTNNLLYNLEEQYSYRSNEGYHIKSHQKIMGLNPSTFEIKGNYLKP